MASRVEINMDEFFASHGEAPRGWGAWIFEISFTGGRTDRFSLAANFSTAKTEAVKAARQQLARGERATVIVMP